MTVVEITVALVILLVAVGGALSSFSSFAVLGESSRETTRAYREAQRMVERLQSERFRTVFARYNDDPADDPAGGAPGSGFDITGLAVRPNDADGFVGQILFPTPAGQPGVLIENVNDADFGLPLDLNADGALDGADRALDHEVLPVRVRVEWRSKSGNRSVELQTILREN